MSNYRNDGIERLAAMFKALANPQRLRIFLKLTSCCLPGERCEASTEGLRRCVGDLGGDLGVSASTVSHHLKALRQAGLLHVERRGQRIECWVAREALELLAEFFGPGRVGDGCACDDCIEPGGVGGLARTC